MWQDVLVVPPVGQLVVCILKRVLDAAGALVFGLFYSCSNAVGQLRMRSLCCHSISHSDLTLTSAPHINTMLQGQASKKVSHHQWLDACNITCRQQQQQLPQPSLHRHRCSPLTRRQTSHHPLLLLLLLLRAVSGPPDAAAAQKCLPG